MKKGFTRSVSLLLAVFLVIVALSACSGDSKTEANTTASNAAVQTETTAAPTTEAATTAPLTPVELTWYLLGDAHADQAKVDEELNKRLKQDLNCTVKMNFTGWGDWQSKYNLLLVSGEQVDMIFASTWADFAKYAKMGAFIDLAAQLPKYAPKTWAEVPQEDWSTSTFDGKIFAVPCTNPEYTPKGLFYREDLRKKYNLPEIKDVASIEAYFDGIKKNCPDMFPVVTNTYEDIANLFFGSNTFESIAGAEDDVVQVKSYDTPRDLVLFPNTDEYVNFCKLTKSWQDKGFWSKDISSSKTTGGDALKAGKSSVAAMTAAAAYGYFNNFKKEHPDWEGGFLPYSSMKGYALPNSPMNNGMAIPNSAKNTDRSLMVLDLLRNNPDYYRLSTYGLQGYHWDLTDDNQKMMVPAKGQDPVKNPGFWTTSWGWANYKLALTNVTAWEGMDAMIQSFRDIGRPNYLIDASIDKESVKAEAAAIKDVQQKYHSILMLGLAPDVDKTITEFRDQLKKAGVDKYFDTIKTGLFKYYDEKGIK